MNPPRVFISYSHDSDDHRAAVRQLAVDLRTEGVDATIDQFVTAPPEGWIAWMAQQIDAAAFVLLVCTATYSRRMEHREDPSKGHGVTYEGQLIAQKIYDAGMNNRKFIPVVLAGSGNADVPTMLRSYTYYALPRQWEALLRHLTEQPEFVPPPLGPRRVLPPRDLTPSSQTTAPAPTTTAPASRPKSTGTKEQQLHNLMLSLFDSDSLRQWLAFGPEGPTVLRQLPGSSAALATLAFDAMGVLRRHGLLDRDFFARLAAEFPHRREDIDAITRLYFP